VLNSRQSAIVVLMAAALTAGAMSRSMAAPPDAPPNAAHSQATVPAAQSTADKIPDQSIAAGKVLFNTVGCWSCHGFNGQGAMSRGIASGPHIDARVLPLEAFAHQLRSPLSVMPPYTEAVLSDAQVADIYNYLRSLPRPPAAQDIPLLANP
jgi:mono/diheme cytochrome c family protein